MENSISSRPLVGRLIALDVRPTRSLTLLGPVWATLCGAIASGGLVLRGQTFLTLVLCLLLCDALLGAWRSLCLRVDWRDELGRRGGGADQWFNEARSNTFFHLRLLNQISRRIDLWFENIWPVIEPDLIGFVVTGALTLSVAIVLGQSVLLLAITAMLVSVIESQIGLARGLGFRALAEIGFPFVIAQAAFEHFSWLALVFAILFTLIYRALLGLVATRNQRWALWSNLSQFAVVLLLVARNTPIEVGIVALGLLAQILWQARFTIDQDGVAYTRRIHWHILVTMFVASLSLWF